MNEFLTVGQVADMFGVSRRTIDRWEKAGAIPRAIRLGGGRGGLTKRWMRSTLAEWAAEQQSRQQAVGKVEA